MKTKKMAKKLVFKKETVSQLNGMQMNKVNGMGEISYPVTVVTCDLITCELTIGVACETIGCVSLGYRPCEGQGSVNGKLCEINTHDLMF